MTKKSYDSRRLLLGLFMSALALGCGSESTLDDAAALFVEAKQAVTDGDHEKAMGLLSASISERPDSWAYLERAKLHAADGNDAAANADIAAGLELVPEHSDLLWLRKEMKKESQSRFKGRSSRSPSAIK